MSGEQSMGNPLAGHLRYVGMSDCDIDALRGVRGFVEQHADAFVERFYAHLLAFEGTRKFLTDEATVRRLLTAQRKYLLSLFDARFDQEYYAHRRIIGQTHFRIGLDFQWYIGAYALYLEFFMPCSMSQTRVTIRVSDNGVGIQAEHVKSLHVCESILKRHEGAIRVESTPGQGATFIIELPVRLQPPAEEMGK